MTLSRHRLALSTLCILFGLCVRTSFGQNGNQTPELFMDLPPVNLTFDSSIGQFSDNAQSIRAAHDIARQQVRLALGYLTTHKAQILAGQDPFYNQFFGSYYNPNNQFAGQYPLEIDGFRLAPSGEFGTFASDEDDPTLLTGSDSSVRATIRVGRRYVFPAENSSLTPIRTVTVVGFADLPDNMEEETLRISSPLFYPDLIDDEGEPGDPGEIRMVRVIEDVAEINTYHYDQVVATFQRISQLLDQPTSYTNAFDQELYDSVFAETNGDFFGFDRTIRQDGFSNSNSSTHLDQLLNDRNNPLSWTDDNLQLLDADGNPLSDDRIYFNDHLTIFGDYDNPNNQTVGDSFLTETQDFIGDFFDGSVSDVSGSTPSEQWQMIIQSFADSSTTLNTMGVAGINVGTVYDSITGGNGDSNFFQNKDAGNFSGFSDLFKNGGGGIGIPNFTPGKQGTAENSFNQLSSIPPDNPFIPQPPPPVDPDGGGDGGGLDPLDPGLPDDGGGIFDPLIPFL